VKMAENVAVVTMSYNEPEFVPIWVKYYGSQYGNASLYIVDHGSDDGSTENLDHVNVVRIPRSPKHNKKRAKFLSEFCSSLLKWYDAVIYTDIDEFLVPDPDSYKDLKDFTDRLAVDTVTAIGLNVTHVPSTDPPLDPAVHILEQRRWARFVFPMCKPLITRVPIDWTPGFHSSDQPTNFDRLFLFHLHNFDLPIGLRRLERTRNMPWGDGAPDHYQRWTDERHEEVAQAIARLSKKHDATFAPDDPGIEPHINWIKEYMVNNPEKRHLFYYQNGIPCNELLRIPDRFIKML
jgi:hypothetical protein